MEYPDRTEWPRYYRNIRAALGHGLGLAVGGIPVFAAPYLFPDSRTHALDMAGHVVMYVVAFVLATRLGIEFHRRIGRRYNESCGEAPS